MSGGQRYVCVPLIAHHRIITGKLAVELLAFEAPAQICTVTIACCKWS